MPGFSLRFSAFAGIMSLAVPATGQAADPLDPVKAVMSVAGWNDASAPKVSANGYFDDSLLSSIYSASFADIYRLADKTDELQDGSGYMLGYDVVIGGQDSCELKDVRIALRGAKESVSVVDVYFDAVSCFGHAVDLTTPQTVFHVIEEDGRFVIDNLWNDDYGDGAVESSVKAQFVAMTEAYLQFRLTGAWSKD
jgi:hypothetical protein